MSIKSIFRTLKLRGTVTAGNMLVFADNNGENVIDGGAPSAGGITQLTADVTAGPGSGSQVATLSTTGVSAATYGDSSHVGQFTVDAKGRITLAADVAITAGGIGAADDILALTYGVAF